MEINVTEYLSHDEIKEIIQEELRLQVRKHFSSETEALRLLGNLSYSIVQEEVDKIVPNHKEKLVSKVSELVLGKHLEYIIFNYRYSDNAPQSAGAIIVDNAVKAHKDLLNEKVKDTILKRDYSEEIWNKFESMADTFISNIYAITEMARKNQTK